jgi:asparagine synthase (glutamine-hydrolysing)
VVVLADSLPDEMLVDNGVRKVALRQVATALGLEGAALRPKKAAQYGSGIMKAMKTMAKSERSSLADWTVKVIAGREDQA